MTQETSTLLITTKDRKRELRNALRSAANQVALTEILVFDDGSSDGTKEMVHEEFPDVRYERAEKSLGIVAARNAAMRLARGSIVIVMDDDCVLQSTSVATCTLRDFRDDRVGAVAIPHVNVNISPQIFSLPTRLGGLFALAHFHGGCCAVRRDLFLALGGFNSLLWRQCEEAEFCLRLLDRGFVTCCGSASPVLHYESPIRDRTSIVFHDARGRLLIAWCTLPTLVVCFHVLGTELKCLRDAIRQHHAVAAVRGIVSGLLAVAKSSRARVPVRLNTYRLMRYLRRSGPIELSSLLGRLPVLDTSVSEGGAFPQS